MIFSKELGRLGARNFEAASTASHVKWVLIFWNNGDSVLSSWIRDRYIKDKDLVDIQSSPSRDSIMWKTILKYKTEIGTLMECGVKSLTTPLI